MSNASEDKKDTKPTESNFRWWEFYAVRYGMGSVVGAVIVYFLCATNPVLQKLLTGLDPTALDAAQLTMLLAYGLTYCYIASAPILVLHAGRFLLEPNRTGIAWKAVTATTVAIVGSVAIYISLTEQTGYALLVYSLMVGLIALLLGIQLVIIFKVQGGEGNKKLYLFYQKLADKRDSKKSSLVESYKHLREHGNSFFIVWLEIVLGVILFIFGNMEYLATSKVSSDIPRYVLPYFIVLFVWITPAMMVWSIATSIESRFADD